MNNPTSSFKDEQTSFGLVSSWITDSCSQQVVVVLVVVVSSACIDGTFTCASPFSSAAGMGFTGTRGDGFTETDLWEGVKTCVGAVVGLWMQYSWCWGSWWSCTVCLQVGHWKSNSESIVRRTKGAGSMNLLGLTVTVQHTGQRDLHILKENDQQLAQNMCGVQHFVWTGWSSTSFQIGHIYSCLVFSTNCSG